MLTSLVDRLAALAAPLRCHWCTAPLASGVACEACRRCLPWNDTACPTCAAPRAAPLAACAACLARPPPQDRAWAAFRYEPPVAAEIVDLKFHGRFVPARVLGELMAQALARRPQPLPTLLVPVPLHEARLRRRGYNQALEIGRELCRRLPLQLAPRAAQRRRATAEQTRLDAAARRRNVRGVFAVAELVRGRHVALLDDVITTGATATELACALREAGAAVVEAWAVARVAPR